MTNKSSLWRQAVLFGFQCFYSDAFFSVRNVLVGSHPLTWTTPEAPIGLATSVSPLSAPLSLWLHSLLSQIRLCLHVTLLLGISRLHLLQVKPSFPRGCAPSIVSLHVLLSPATWDFLGHPLSFCLGAFSSLCWIPCVHLSSRKCLVLF